MSQIFGPPRWVDFRSGTWWLFSSQLMILSPEISWSTHQLLDVFDFNIPLQQSYIYDPISIISRCSTSGGYEMIWKYKLPQISIPWTTRCPQQLRFRTVSGLTPQTPVPTPPTRAQKPPTRGLPMERPAQGRRLALGWCLVAMVLGGLRRCCAFANRFLAEAETDFCFD